MPSRSAGSPALRLLPLVVAALLLVSATPASAQSGCSSASGTEFTQTSASDPIEHCFTVPEGVDRLYVEAQGAAGAAWMWASPGIGALVRGFVEVTPGELLYVNVGVLGFSQAGGYNGGGAAGGGGAFGGGGATDIRRCSITACTTLSPDSRMLVAACGGGPGTQTAGGAGGVFSASDLSATGTNGSPGSLARGGDGGAGSTGGGGGGAGLYGGGGGSGSDSNTDGGGGGGGSSLVPPNGTVGPGDGYPRLKVSYAAGDPADIAAVLTDASIPADGTSTTTVTATVTDANEDPLPYQRVSFATDGDQTIGAVVDHHDGTYTATVTAGTVAGDDTITADVDGLSASATLEQTPGPVTAIDLTLGSDLLPADGTSKSTVTAALEDANGNAVPGAPLTIESPAGHSITTPADDDGDGTYTAELTATTTPGSTTITATSGEPTDTATLTQHVPCQTGAAATFTPSGVHEQCYVVPENAQRMHVRAVGAPGGGDDAGGDNDGGPGAVVHGHLTPVPGQTLILRVGGPADGRFGGANGGGDGGTELSPAHGGGGATDLRLCREGACAMTPSDPRLLVAAGGGGAGARLVAGGGAAGQDGESVVAEEANQYGCSAGDGGCGGGRGTASAGGAAGSSASYNPTAGTAGTLGAGGIGGAFPSSVMYSDDSSGGGGGGGLYGGGGGSASIHGGGGGGGGSSLAPAGFAVAQAADRQPRMQINVIDAPASALALELTPPEIAGDGTSTTTAVATVTDEHGHGVFGEEVSFATTGGQAIGTVTDNGDGTYSAEITSTDAVTTATITATSGDLTDDATLTQVAEAPADVTVALDDALLAAGGDDSATATIDVADDDGDPIEGAEVSLESDRDQVVGAVTDAGGGTYTATVDASSEPGTSVLTATAGTATGTAKLHQHGECVSQADATFAEAGDEEQCFAVPAGAKQALVEAVGAPGEGGARGARVAGLVPVTPDSVLMVRVGTAGDGQEGGFNGGGTGGDGRNEDWENGLFDGGGGGGASDVRACPEALCALSERDTRLLVAAGGGGRGGATAVGDPARAGGAAGATGDSYAELCDSGSGSCGGDAGGETSGGVGGARNGGEALGAGGAGARGAGGVGGEVPEGWWGTGGGGGGGGLFGGGGGSAGGWYGEPGGGGGGGSSLTPPGGTEGQASTATPSLRIALNGGDPATVELALDPSTLTADGTSETVATATVEDADGDPVFGADVEIESDGEQAVSDVTDNFDGTYSATITATEELGASVVTAKLGSLTDEATLTQEAGPVAKIDVNLAKDAIVGLPRETTTATITVADAHDHAVAGRTVTVTSDGTQAIGPVTDNGDGTYTASVRASETGARNTITATADGVTGSTVLRQHRPCSTAQFATFGLVNQTQCFQVPEDVTEVRVTTIGARSGSSRGAQVAGTLAVTPGARLGIEVGGDGTGRLGGYNGGGDGGTGATGGAAGTGGGGSSDVRACLTETCEGIDGDPRLVIAAGAGGAGGAPDAAERRAGGDADNGGESVDTGDGCPAFGGCGGGAGSDTGGTGGGGGFGGFADAYEGGDGSAGQGGRGGNSIDADWEGGSGGGGGGGGRFGGGGGSGGVAIPGGGGGGGSSITPEGFEWDWASTPAGVRIAYRGGEPADLDLAVVPGSVVADGVSTATATATVTDEQGRYVYGEEVAFDAGDNVVGEVTDHGNGTYSATITSTTALGTVTVTATSGDGEGAVSDSADLQQVAGPPETVEVDLDPAALPADGKATATATATVEDVAGHPLGGRTVTFETDGGQRLGTVTDHGDGTYSAAVTSTETQGASTITARTGGKSGTAQLTQIAPCRTSHVSTFTAAGAEQCFTVPAGVDELSVESIGAPGAGGAQGDRVRSVVPVTPGARLSVLVGGAGTGMAGGFNGGGSGGAAGLEDGQTPQPGGGGGGASDVRTCSSFECALGLGDPRLLVAGGGGGNGGTADGHHDMAGGAAGADGADVVCGESVAACAGKAGGTSAGGAGGAGSDYFGIPAGGAGARGPGGNGTAGLAGGGGGGGGGGWFGGGGASGGRYTHGAGGGGGSSHAPSGSRIESAAGRTPVVVVRYNAGTPHAVDVQVDDSELVADGIEKTKVVATVTDAQQRPVFGEAVTLTSSTGDVIGPVVDEGDGTYTAELTSTTKAGTATITAAAGALTDTTTLRQVAGAPTSIALTLDPASIIADGTAKTTARALLTDAHGNGVGGAAVQVWTNGYQSVGDVVDKGDGVYEAPVTSTTAVGTASIEASLGELKSTQTLTQVPGPPAHVALLLAPARLVADGAETSTATVTVLDAHNNPVPGATVALKSDGGQGFGTVVDKGSGVYEATVTASKKAGISIITATAGDAKQTAELEQVPGPPTGVAVELSPDRIVADGTATTTATARVVDANGNAIEGHAMQLTADNGLSVGELTTTGADHTATIRSTTKAGTATVTGQSGAFTGTATLTQVAGAPATVELALDPATIVADGASTTKATAIVEDAYDNRVSDAQVTLTSSGGQAIGSVAGKGDGVYESTITSSKVAGAATITAATGGKSGTATLTQVPGEAAKVELELDPAQIVANGTATTKATMKVTDVNGNVRPDAATLSTDGGQSIATPVVADDGSRSAIVTATTRAGSSTLTATSGALTGTATLVQVAGVADEVDLVLEPASIVADGASTTTATATVADAHGNPVTASPPAIVSDDPQAIGAVAHEGDGVYTATVTSTKQAGDSTITATSGPASASAVLRQVPGAPARITLALAPDTLVADGSSATEATASVVDANDNRIAGQAVTIAADGGQAVGGVDARDDGTHRARITSTTRAGRSAVTARSGDLTARGTLTQVAGAPARLELSLSPSSIPADGSARTTATARLADRHGNAVTGAPVAFAAAGDLPVGGTADHGDGTYSAPVTATRAAATRAVTARVAGLEATADLVLTPVDERRLKPPVGRPPAVVLDRLSARRWCIGENPAVRRDGKPDKGLSFRFRVSSDARLSYVLQRRNGAEPRTRCPKPPPGRRARAKAGASAAPKYTALARKRQDAAAGDVRVWIAKLLKKDTSLEPGSYRLHITATDRRGTRSAPLVVTFWVLADRD